MTTNGTYWIQLAYDKQSYYFDAHGDGGTTGALLSLAGLRRAVRYWRARGYERGVYLAPRI